MGGAAAAPLRLRPVHQKQVGDPEPSRSIEAAAWPASDCQTALPRPTARPSLRERGVEGRSRLTPQRCLRGLETIELRGAGAVWVRFDNRLLNRPAAQAVVAGVRPRPGLRRSPDRPPELDSAAPVHRHASGRASDNPAEASSTAASDTRLDDAPFPLGAGADPTIRLRRDFAASDVRLDRTARSADVVSIVIRNFVK